MQSSFFTLLELNRIIKSTIEDKFSSTIWVTAEINNINEHRNGHCYLELIQKANDRDIIIAQTRAVIWSQQYRLISGYFESIANTKLSKGIKVLVKVSVDFHELYGLSLNIRDIDPNYTLGDLERRKKEIIDKLINEGVIDMNKSLELPLVIKNIAIISSSNAAGFEDFVNQLSDNKYGYQYNISLFEADMQGINTENSVIEAFNCIYNNHDKFDIVAILRGGGSKSDLSFFDNYNIAFYITQFPIPVFSGIGHERDDSVTDLVAHTRLKTPTAVANYVIDHTLHFENDISDLYNHLINSSFEFLKTNELYITTLSLEIFKSKDILVKNIEKCNKQYYHLKNLYSNKIRNKIDTLEKYNYRLKDVLFNKFNKEEGRLNNKYMLLKQLQKEIITNETNKLNILEQNIRLINPANILKRGYTISKINGNSILKSDNINPGDEMETISYKTKITSIISKKNLRK